MGLLILFIKVAMATFAVSVVVRKLYSERHNFGFIRQVVSRFRWLMFVEALLTVAITIAAVVILVKFPPLRYGWMHLFMKGGGNIIAAPVLAGASSPNLLIRAMVPLFFILLAVALPFLAKSEEESFRKGHHETKDVVCQSVKFGLAHCIVGIPLGAGIALIIPGLLFGFKYKRAYDRLRSTSGEEEATEAALFESTVYHTLYNMIIAAIAVSATTFMIFAP